MSARGYALIDDQDVGRRGENLTKVNPDWENLANFLSRNRSMSGTRRARTPGEHLRPGGEKQVAKGKEWPAA